MKETCRWCGVEEHTDFMIREDDGKWYCSDGCWNEYEEEKNQ